MKVPFTTKPEDIGKLLNKLPEIEIPAGKIEADFFQKMGFTTASSRYLLEIFEKLDFIDAEKMPSATWHAYIAAENKGLVLATAIKRAYAALFEYTMCPYLEDDSGLYDYFKGTEKATNKEHDLAVHTFRALAESADFQDLMCVEGNADEKPALPALTQAVKVNPNLQVTVQVHIDPATSDEKIETIFKNMRKYLLDKES
jgi:hypothetical protein